MIRCSAVTKPLLVVLTAFFSFAACSSQPAKPTVPALTPQVASALLQMHPRAKNWLIYVKKQNPACDYRIELPSQLNHPRVIDIGHAIACGSQPAPLAMNASVTYVYNEDAGHWEISRFAS